MSSQLNGKHILVITSNPGIARDELLKPLETLRGYGATVTHASSKGGTTQTFVGDTEKDQTVESDVQLSDVVSADFDALVIPGGTV
ncbi:protease, partial [Pseudomonas syringae]|uniref:DJ-1/PfpI family protein n=1 Tax=Pseudomonas syringae TaxID=317 RepID=UPI001F297FBB